MTPTSTLVAPSAALPFRSSAQHQQPQQQAANKKRQPTGTRMARPAPLTRRDTAGQKSSHHHHHHHHHSHRLSSSTSKSSSARSSIDETDDLMAGSFLQFCATCEKQITTPNSTGLYCSERCRSHDTSLSATKTYALFQKDASRVTPPASPHVVHHHSPSSPYNPYSSCDDSLYSRDIIPQRSPTQNLRHSANTHSISYQLAESSRTSSSEDMDSLLSPSAHRSELSRSTPRKSSADKDDSDAFHYLSQFHSVPHDPVRSKSSRRGQTPLVATGPPSLSHTPSASSVGGGSSFVSTPLASNASAGAGGGYFERRPVIPMRASTAFSASKSVDLVTPLTEEYAANSLGAGQGSEDTLVPVFEKRYEVTVEAVPDHDQTSRLSYEKRRTSGQNLAAIGSANGSAGSRLKQMFEAEQQRGRRK